MDWNTSDTISVLSALAAVASAIYAGKTYGATLAIKKHDFCLQLRTANSTLHASVAELPDLLDHANRSRQAIDAAEGMRGSGAAQKWQSRIAAAQTEIEALQLRLPPNDKFEERRLEELTSLIAATHEFQARAAALKAELQEGLRHDDERRSHRRADMRAATAAQMAQPLKTRLGG